LTLSHSRNTLGKFEKKTGEDYLLLPKRLRGCWLAAAAPITRPPTPPATPATTTTAGLSKEQQRQQD